MNEKSLLLLQDIAPGDPPCSDAVCPLYEPLCFPSRVASTGSVIAWAVHKTLSGSRFSDNADRIHGSSPARVTVRSRTGERLAETCLHQRFVSTDRHVLNWTGVRRRCETLPSKSLVDHKQPHHIWLAGTYEHKLPTGQNTMCARHADFVACCRHKLVLWKLEQVRGRISWRPKT